MESVQNFKEVQEIYFLFLFFLKTGLFYKKVPLVVSQLEQEKAPRLLCNNIKESNFLMHQAEPC